MWQCHTGLYIRVLHCIFLYLLRFTIIFSKKKTGNAQKPTIYDCRGAYPKHNGKKRIKTQNVEEGKSTNHKA